MKRNVLLLITTILLSLQGFSQQPWLNVPDVLNDQFKQSFLDKINSGEKSLGSLETTKDKQWKVYADREGVWLKNRYGGGNNGNKLNFMEPLLISEVNGKWLHVYNAVTKAERGWVQARYLILSRFSLKTEGKVSVPRKAIVLTSLDELVEGEIKPEEILEQKHYYNDPSPQTGTVIGTPRRFTILFVLKEQDGSVLLSTTDILAGNDIENSSKVLGWMPKANRTPWSTRACLEPASNENNPHKVGDNKWPGYKNLSKMTPCLDKNICSKDGRFIEFHIGKIHAYRMRYPILSNKNNTENIKQVVSIAKDVTEDTISTGSVDFMIEKLKSMSKQTNIIFAIDATASMKPYYSSVARSLNKIIDKNEELNQHKIKFGLVIYRDYADGNDAFSYEPLTTDYELIQRKLTNTTCRSRDTDKAEAQYNGLIKGINALNLDKSQSNVVVLIGDCGNHNPDPKGLTSDHVIDIFIEKNINLIAFQVISKSNQFWTYNKFNTDAQAYVINTARDKISEINTTLKYEWEAIPSENTYKLKWIDQSVCNFENMFGRFVFAELDQDIQPSLLEQAIVNTLSVYMSTIDENIRILEDIINGGTGCGMRSGTFVDDPPEGVIVYIMNNFKNPDGTKWSREQAIEYLKKTEVTVKAFVAMNYKKEGRVSIDINENALRHVVFLTHKELTKLKKELKKLTSIQCDGVSKQKKCFQEQMINIVKSILGPQTSFETIEELTMNEIWLIVFGVEFEDGDIRGLTLNDLSSVKKRKFKDFYKEFISTSEIFTSKSYFHTNQFKSRQLKLNQDKFYWVPLEDLPGTTKKQ